MLWVFFLCSVFRSFLAFGWFSKRSTRYLRADEIFPGIQFGFSECLCVWLLYVYSYRYTRRGRDSVCFFLCGIHFSFRFARSIYLRYCHWAIVMLFCCFTIAFSSHILLLLLFLLLYFSFFCFLFLAGFVSDVYWWCARYLVDDE